MKDPMRGLFLDFDGVVHPVSEISDRRSSVAGVDLPHLIQSRRLLRWMPLLVQTLSDHPDVLVVVHSGWRGLASNTQLREFLGPLADRFVGVTSLHLPRYDGILRFADRAGFDDYLIIDDDAQEFPPELSSLVVTDPELGLSDGHSLAQLEQWLDATSPALIPMPGMKR